MKKYAEERDKRVKAEGTKQYIELVRSEKFIKYIEDPWVKAGTPINTPVPQDGHCKFVIMGAGFGGILFAIRLIEAGYKASDLVSAI
jgi:NADH dehydrogenase FAD-containing subunit